MYINDLVIEVTRFCNMNCPHCLRGEKQRKKFDINYLDNVFYDIDNIGTITFTGGEPLTQVNTIIEVLNYIVDKSINIGSFYIVSNGTIYSKKLMSKLKYVYDNVVYEKELCSFEVSQDIYHDDFFYEREINIVKYEELKEYYGYNFINMSERKKIYSVILEGRAKTNFSDGRKATFNNGFYSVDDELYYENMVYIASNGNVISNCDLSFETVDKNSFGNVKNETLKSIVERNTKEKVDAIILQ